MDLNELERERDRCIQELGFRYWRWRSWYDAPLSLAGPHVGGDLQRAVVAQEARIREVEEQIRDSKATGST